MNISFVTRSVSALAVLGLALAGCSGGEQGTAQPASTTTTPAGSQSSSTGSPTSTPGGEGDLSKLKACALLESAASVGLTSLTEEGPTGCGAKHPGRVSVALDIRSKGIADYSVGPNAKPVDVSIGKHKGKQVTGAVSKASCAVVIGVTDKSRVDVFASSDSDPQQACDAAMSIATAIEPKLP